MNNFAFIDASLFIRKFLGIIKEQETENATTFFDNYALINNMWGKWRLNPEDTYTQFTYVTKNGYFPLGWRWKCDTTLQYVKGFPQILFGTNPYSHIWTTYALPAKLSTIKSCNITYDVKYLTDGLFNLAFDIWITSEKEPTRDNIKYELMIWLDGNIPLSDGYKETRYIDGINYKVYIQNEGKLIIFQLINKPLKKATINIKSFLNYLCESDNLANNYYLACVELGTEMWHGQGFTSFDNFRALVEYN